ncbi:putative defense protein 2 [Amphibalanus amphitrite]|uniref:putative defense protein 2 n=1 Tax=Amphibalanus amphitrite TaxID=1232801 RepID=UPI001C929D89|nr:putative defense protein 2 [Amphibalanus amphitrite]XP_043247386.1 putative defense protein 2 [Amphibalanus amphitrite]
MSLRVPLLLLTVCVPALYAFPDGAPAEACLRNMEPNHSGAKSRNPLDSPFAVFRHTSPGRVTVTIRSLTGNAYMKGFMVQARDPLTGKAARGQGAWLPIANVKGLPECAAVTHADRGQKTEAAVTWEGRTDLAFYVTIVESYSSFWANVEALEQGGLSGPSGLGSGPSGFGSGPGPHLGGLPSGPSGPGPLARVPPSGLSALSAGPSGVSGFGNSFHPFAGKKK